MKNIYIRMLALSLLTQSWYEAKAIDSKDFPIIGVAMAVASFATGGITYLVFGKNRDAERFEQERLLLQERQQQEEKKSKEDAKKILHALEKKYADYVTAFYQKGCVTKEDMEQQSLVLMHETPFIHVNYSRQLHNDLNALRTSSFSFSEEEEQKAKKIESFLETALSKNNELFKAVIAAEFENEKKAIAAQKKLDYEIGADRERYEAKVIKRQCFEEQRKGLADLRNESQKAIKSVSDSAHEKLSKMSEQASALYTANSVHYGSIMRAIHEELDQHGLHAMSKQIKFIKDEIDHVCKNVSTSVEHIKKIKEELHTFKQDLINQVRDNCISKGELAAMLRKIDQMENALAIISADVGDIKSGNPFGEPSAPPRNF